MKRVHLVLAGLLAASLVVPVQAQEMTPELWSQFQQKITSTCVSVQKALVANQSLKPGVIEETCSCIGTKITGRAKLAPDFQAISASQDKAKFNQMMNTFSIEPNGANVMNVCIDIVKTAHADGVGAPAQESKASTKIGLTGKDKTAFVKTSTKACQESLADEVQSLRHPASKIANYCGCLAEGIAKKVSLRDIENAVRAGGSRKRLDEVQSELTPICHKREL